MSELGKRLREAIKYCDKEKQILMMLLIRDAADEIERLEEYRDHHEFAVQQLAEICGRKLTTIGDVAAEIERLEKERDELKAKLAKYEGGLT